MLNRPKRRFPAPRAAACLVHHLHTIAKGYYSPFYHTKRFPAPGQLLANSWIFYDIIVKSVVLSNVPADARAVAAVAVRRSAAWDGFLDDVVQLAQAMAAIVIKAQASDAELSRVMNNDLALFAKVPHFNCTTWLLSQWSSYPLRLWYFCRTC